MRLCGKCFGDDDDSEESDGSSSEEGSDGGSDEDDDGTVFIWVYVLANPNSPLVSKEVVSRILDCQK